MLMKKYILIICVILCVMLAACGKDEDPVDIIYAPVDTTTQTNKDTEPKDTEDTADTDEIDTADTSDSGGLNDTPDDTTSTNTENSDDTTDPIEDTEDDEKIDYSDFDYVLDISEALSNGEAAKGQIASKQSDRIRLLVNYVCEFNPDINQVVVDLEVLLEVYDINCGARDQMGKIIIDGEKYSYSTDALSLNNHVKSYVRFATHTYQIPRENTSCTLDISWPFNGKYGDDTIKDLRTTAIIVLANDGFDA